MPISLVRCGAGAIMLLLALGGPGVALDGGQTLASPPTRSAPPIRPADTQGTHRPDAAACRNPEALGVSRVLDVGAEGGLFVGLKTYPRSLPLRDHEVVLTFDDGPSPDTTPLVLDALDRECVKATFFLIGRHAEQNPGLVRREIAEGHTIGSHTWSHPDATLRGLSEPAALAEIDHGIAAVDRAGWGGPKPDGQPHPAFFRFPGFADTEPLKDALARRNIAVFGTDMWASDWRPMSPATELNLILQRLDEAGRGIILFHDTRAQTAAMLPDFLRQLRARHFTIVHLRPADGAMVTAQAPATWVPETEGIVERVLARQNQHHALARRPRRQEPQEDEIDTPADIAAP